MTCIVHHTLYITRRAWHTVYNMVYCTSHTEYNMVYCTSHTVYNMVYCTSHTVYNMVQTSYCVDTFEKAGTKKRLTQLHRKHDSAQSPAEQSGHWELSSLSHAAPSSLLRAAYSSQNSMTEHCSTCPQPTQHSHVYNRRTRQMDVSVNAVILWVTHPLPHLVSNSPIATRDAVCHHHHHHNTHQNTWPGNRTLQQCPHPALASFPSYVFPWRTGLENKVYHQGLKVVSVWDMCCLLWDCGGQLSPKGFSRCSVPAIHSFVLLAVRLCRTALS